VAGACGDQVAVNAIMGLVDSSMAAVYREEFQDVRLIKAVETVREWHLSVEKGTHSPTPQRVEEWPYAVMR